jgi:DNA mismatch repair protein MutS2
LRARDIKDMNSRYLSAVAFARGDFVHVASLGKGVVLEGRNANRYLVEVKGRAVVVTGDQLEHVDLARRRRRTHATETAGRAASEPDLRITRSIDLHGKTVVAALEALDGFINEALLANASELRIIHGRSGGHLKAAVHARLAQLPASRRFRIDRTNPGVTIVDL